MTWAGKRQLFIILGALIIVLAILFPIVKPIVAPQATCFDGKKNQGESGVDCSGPCNKICTFEAAPPSVLWARPFKVANGVVSATAYISNPNPNFEAKGVRYTMRVYDERNLLVGERYGVVDIPAKATFPVFEGGISSGNSQVKTAFFQFLDEPVWQKVTEESSHISFGPPILSEDTPPKISVSAKNESSNPVKDVPVIVVVFNSEGNAIASSQTLIDTLNKNESTTLVFTWGLPFEGESNRIEVYARLPIAQ